VSVTKEREVAFDNDAEGGNLLALFVFVRSCSPCPSLDFFLFTLYQGKQCNALGFAVNIAVKGYSSSVTIVLLSDYA
jgi:hypothetical protein